MQTYSKQSIALAQLETALRLFSVGEDLISVITLAGAAEEILGKLVKSQGRDNSLDFPQENSHLHLRASLLGVH